MPYIKKDRRAAYDPIVEALQQRLRINGCERGDVNYVVTRIALGVLASVPGYKNYSDAIAALQDAADEIKRRCLSSYEDFSEAANNDVPEMVESDRLIDERWQAMLDRHAPVVDSPLPQVAADQYQDLQDEIKETFERR